MKRDELKLTPRGKHAVMAMVELARNEGKGPLPLSQIAQTGRISLSYLEQLFAGLRRRGLVKSHRGPGGGYLLAVPAREIFITDILTAAEDNVPARRQAVSNDDMQAGNKETQELWSNIGQVLHVYLRQVSLDDIAASNLETHPATNKIFETLR
ncbi:MAG TPA: Rrf2 family transcriptional regulator [Alphaproteobacteria bacterium]|jgi:Rrf2 family iron-sulfur cluster assembly transcriptional regulator